MFPNSIKQADIQNLPSQGSQPRRLTQVIWQTVSLPRWNTVWGWEVCRLPCFCHRVVSNVSLLQCLQQQGKPHTPNTVKLIHLTSQIHWKLRTGPHKVNEVSTSTACSLPNASTINTPMLPLHSGLVSVSKLIWLFLPHSFPVSVVSFISLSLSFKKTSVFPLCGHYFSLYWFRTCQGTFIINKNTNDYIFT